MIAELVKFNFNKIITDSDKKAGITRYFEEVAVESMPTRLVCKHCGAEGEHKTRECTVLIVRINLLSQSPSIFINKCLVLDLWFSR
jgi:hypothetical protein